MRGWKPKTYDVGRQIKAIEAFEVLAVKGAEDTKGRVDEELRDLEKTLKNIEDARPFEDLTVVRLAFVASLKNVMFNGRTTANYMYCNL